MKFAQYFVCTLFLAGMVACNQQSQSQIEQTISPVVKPAEPEKTTGPTRPYKPARPVKPTKQVKPARPVAPVQPQPEAPLQGGQAEVTVTPAPAPVQQPVKLKPLGKRVSHVPMKGKYVALTFDDGPHPSLTSKALDILNRHGAKGTFFMLGQNVARYKSVVASAAAGGHELGVHTWSHIKMNSCARAKVDSEVSRTQNLIASITGTVPRVMRPPYGATNKTLVNHMYSHYGMASILWDVDTLDWRKPGVDKVISTAVNKAAPGSIILVHDIHASTINALEGIVTGLQARGFQLVTVSELMQIGKREAAETAAAEAAAAEAAAAAAAGTDTMDTEPLPAEPLPTGQPVNEPVQEAPVVVPEAPAADTPAPAAEEAPALKLENFIIH